MNECEALEELVIAGTRLAKAVDDYLSFRTNATVAMKLSAMQSALGLYWTAAQYFRSDSNKEPTDTE